MSQRLIFAVRFIVMAIDKTHIQRLKAIVEVEPLAANQRLNKSEPDVIVLEEKKGGIGEFEPVMKAYPSVAHDRKEEGMIEVWAKVDMKESVQGTRCVVIAKSKENSHLIISKNVFVIFDLDDYSSWGIYTKEKIGNIKG